MFFRDIEEEQELWGPDYDTEHFEEYIDDHQPGFAVVVLPLLAVVDADLGNEWLHGHRSIDEIKKYSTK